MSNRKRQVAFTKPEEPDFLKRMKAEIGYKEPEEEIDKKREAIENLSDDDEDYMEKDDEKPLVVQLRDGDLTEEEAAKLAKEEAEKPADLSQKIVFKKNAKKEKSDDSSETKIPTVSLESEKIPTVLPKKEGKSKRKSKPTKSLLSFENVDDDEV